MTPEEVNAAVEECRAALRTTASALVSAGAEPGSIAIASMALAFEMVNNGDRNACHPCAEAELVCAFVTMAHDRAHHGAR